MDIQSNLEVLLSELIKSWTTYELLRKWISRFFHSYNKMTTTHHKNKLHSNTLSLEEYKNSVFAQFRIQIIDGLIF